MSTIPVAATSIRRAWRRDENGSFWLRFRPSAGQGDATSAFSEAVAAEREPCSGLRTSSRQVA